MSGDQSKVELGNETISGRFPRTGDLKHRPAPVSTVLLLQVPIL